MDSIPPIISVIMPVYNGTLFLREAIESILNQSFADYEFIIINDGSTDDSANIISKYSKLDGRIKFINHENNTGLIEVLNLGLSLAKGKYIARMDADDVSLKKRFADQYRFLETHPEIGVVGSNVHFINSAGHRISNFINNPRLPQTPNQINWALCFSCCLMHPTIMARRELLINFGGYNKLAKHAEDYDLWVRMAATTKFYNLPTKLLLLRRHETNITVVYLDTTLSNSIKISQKWIFTILGHDSSQDISRILWNHTLSDLTDISQILEYFDELFRVFKNRYHLDSTELVFIKKDLVKQAVNLFIQNIAQPGIKALFSYAIKINSLETISIIAQDYFRRTWKTFKKK